jgi:hypothetical protein
LSGQRAFLLNSFTNLWFALKKLARAGTLSYNTPMQRKTQRALISVRCKLLALLAELEYTLFTASVQAIWIAVLARQDSGIYG